MSKSKKNSKSSLNTNVKLTKRSKKYIGNLEKLNTALNGKETLPLNEAIKLLFSFDKPNFKQGPTVELHVKLNINPTKSDQLVRSHAILPHGTGNKIRVAAFVLPENVEKALKAGADLAGGEELIEEIKNSGKINFDKAIAEPEMMKRLPAVARILGIAGVMPNPKTGTVGTDIETMIKEIKAGKVDFKNDKSANLHLICGKINEEFDEQKITENIQAAMEAVEKSKPEIKKKFILTCHLATTQSPSIRFI